MKLVWKKGLPGYGNEARRIPIPGIGEVEMIPGKPLEAGGMVADYLLAKFPGIIEEYKEPAQKPKKKEEDSKKPEPTKEPVKDKGKGKNKK